MAYERRPNSRGRPFKRSMEFSPPAWGRIPRFQLPAGTKIDYKNLAVLQKFVTDRGKIVSRRLSGLSSRRQRELAAAIKRAKFLGLLTVGIRKK